MFINIPRGKTLEELYDWCCELAEMLNREKESDEKENDNVNDIHH